MAEGRGGGDFRLRWNPHPFKQRKGGVLGKMSALEVVFHPELDGSGIALCHPEVSEHFRVHHIGHTVKLLLSDFDG